MKAKNIINIIGFLATAILTICTVAIIWDFEAIWFKIGGTSLLVFFICKFIDEQL